MTDSSSMLLKNLTGLPRPETY